MPTKKVNRVVQSLARLQQIKKTLIKADRDEKKAQKALDKSGRATEIELLKLRSTFLEERLELYNEQAQIQGDLVHTGLKPPAGASREEIIAVAKRLDLAKLLRDQRHQRVVPTGWCLTSCEKCVTSCEKCVSSCEICVTSCGAQGAPIGRNLPVG
jgi:hypothetical protein